MTLDIGNMILALQDQLIDQEEKIQSQQAVITELVELVKLLKRDVDSFKTGVYAAPLTMSGTTISWTGTTATPSFAEKLEQLELKTAVEDMFTLHSAAGTLSKGT